MDGIQKHWKTNYQIPITPIAHVLQEIETFNQNFEKFLSARNFL